MASRNVIIKFEQGEPVTVKDVPANVSIDQVKQSIMKKFPDKKIVGTSEADYRPDPKNLKPGEKPMVDIEKSSEKPAGNTPAVDASSDESKKDYRADFPTLYTPPGFIRNKRGDLIYY